MEFSVREWTIIVGVLLIVAVFLDGYRRVRNERSNRIRVTLSKQVFNQPGGTQPLPEETTNHELPGGGARIVAKRRNDDLNLHQSVPVLIEPVVLAPDPQPEPEPEFESEAELEPEPEIDVAHKPVVPAARSSDERIEPVMGTDDYAALEAAGQDAFEDILDELPERYVEPPAVLTRAEIRNANAKNAAAQNPTIPSPTTPSEPVQGAISQPSAPVQNTISSPPSEKANSKRKDIQRSFDIDSDDDEPGREVMLPQEVLVVNVLAKGDAAFKGPDLLQLLLACDLRFGEMNIFHRYEKANGKGPIQFSVANLVEPGSFDLDDIDDFSTPGVTFFLTLPGPDKPVTAFNYMVETAQVLVRHLHAELRDDAHSVMTAQTIEHFRQRIRDFERKQLTLQL
jgi:cell division protein ZipA